MSHPCEYCTESFGSYTEYRKHLIHAHPKKKPFQCDCGVSYKHKSSLVRHQDTCPARSKKRKREPDTIQTPPNISKAEPNTLSTFQEFLLWCNESPDRPTAESAQQICRFLLNEGLHTASVDWTSSEAFDDRMNEKEDEWTARGLKMTTMANYYRYLSIYGAYVSDMKHSLGEFVHELILERISSLQTASTRATVRENCLTLLDPYSMATLRNSIIDQLNRVQQQHIDPFISEHLLGSSPPRTTDTIRFGEEHLKPWLDLCIRFTNIPARVQCTIYLQLPSSTDHDYVSKLVLRKGQYVRVINGDKTKHVYQPVAIPLGPILSWYLEFYLRFCRPEPRNEQSAKYVFLTKQGSLWKNASKHIKEYMKDHVGMDPCEIDPSGRFVHGSRHIVLATYALRVHFDELKLRNFALLMRHSIQTAMKFYNVWTDICRSRSAVRDFATVMELPDCKEMNTIETPNMVYSVLGRPRGVIRSCMSQFLDHYNEPSFVPQYTVKDASTQTTDGGEDVLIAPTPSPQKKVQHPNSSVPTCTVCQSPLALHGPCGNSRHKKFGHYFLQCVQCIPHKRITKHAKVYPLGYTPPEHVKSVSSIPRNMKNILKYIEENK